MKYSSLSKVVGAGALALSIAIVPLAIPASAQNNAESNNPTLDTTPFQETKNDNNNFGWLGLLGLIGLANLLRQRKEPARYRDPNEVSPSGYTDPNAVNPPGYTDPNDVNRPGYTDPNR